MKVFWKVPQQQLQMEAESAAELNVIRDLVHGGPMAGAHYLLVQEEELGFVRGHDDGIVSLINGPRIVAGLVWDAGAAKRQREVLNAQQALGQAIYKLFSLLPVEPKVDLAQSATGVAPV
jgi:hypothetical protein